MKKCLVCLLSVLLVCSLLAGASAEVKVHINQTPPADWQERDLLRLIAFKVTPCDAMLLQCGGESMMIDSGTRKFARVLEQALKDLGYGNTEDGRMRFAKWALKIPILGNISSLNGASQFANSMATMLQAGLPLNKAVSITAKTMDNYFLSTETGKLSGKLEEGKALGSSMREANYMPDILVDMVGVGEETGEMEDTLHTIAGYYDAELQMATDAALKKMEPALLVGLAGIAGFIVIAIYMAMFSMYGSM